MAKTLFFQYRGPGFDPCLWNKILHAATKNQCSQIIFFFGKDSSLMCFFYSHSTADTSVNPLCSVVEIYPLLSLLPHSYPLMSS